MDVTKLLWILQNNALYFARCDLLGDPFEGHYTRAFSEARKQFIEFMIKEHPPENLSLPNYEKTMGGNYDRMIQAVIDSKQQYFVNCWHLNEIESGAMWKLYTSMNDAVCIRTSYKSLAKCLPDDVFFGMVTYINYEQEVINFGNSLNYISHKRASFAHEREARGVIWSRASPSLNRKTVNENRGMVVSVDVKELIKEIYLSPSANPPLLEVITKLVKDFGLNILVKQSEVNAGPTY